MKTAMVLGLAGALMMLCGDMALYYSPDDYGNDGTLEPIINIMKKLGRRRLYIGGLLGPFAAFVYCLGYYHIPLMTDEKHLLLGQVCFLVNCLGIIGGGAYHSHCANLGLIPRHGSAEDKEEVLRYLGVQKNAFFIPQAAGFIVLAVLVAAGWTVLPRWYFLLTPGVLMLLLPLMRKLPKGLHMVVCGGWTNMISVIYYAAALISVSV
ncbi:DUF6796 family protein [Ruminococcus sp.]|uniref:DUF6796 family protein n=1 Tax=Ruminococcus sp. TaxID=41978 RepID=UPI0025E7D0CD|nr:DUF6796 family protein [Ruminococcus sp.]